MTRWLAPGAINIIWTKKIYNGLHVRCVEEICVPSTTHHSLALSLFHSFSLSLSCSHSLVLSLSYSLVLSREHIHSYSLSLSLKLQSLIRAFDSRVLIQLIASLAIAPHLRILRLLSLLHSLMYLHTFDSQQSYIALRGGTRPSPRANSPIFRSNKYQQRDSYTGSNPSLSYALINYDLTI